MHKARCLRQIGGLAGAAIAKEPVACLHEAGSLCIEQKVASSRQVQPGRNLLSCCNPMSSACPPFRVVSESLCSPDGWLTDVRRTTDHWQADLLKWREQLRCYSTGNASNRASASLLMSKATNLEADCCHSSTQSRLSCSCAAVDARLKPTVPPHPGTVSPYNHHVMIRAPPPLDQPPQDNTIWWPPIVERNPALVQAFAAVAENKAAIDGVVKVTAWEGVEKIGPPKRRDQKTVDLMIFPAGVTYSALPQEKIKEVVAFHVADPVSSAQSLPLPELGPKARESEFKGLGLFVCTHMSRDSRCGVIGREVAKRLQTLVDEQGLDLIQIYQVSHVGGHKYAGNVLVYGSISPCDGDWFGGINKDNAEAFLDAVVGVEVGVNGGLEDPVLRKYWRGRMGLTQEEQIELYEQAAAIPTAELMIDDDVTSDTDSSELEGGATSSSSESSDEEAQQPLKAAEETQIDRRVVVDPEDL